MVYLSKLAKRLALAGPAAVTLLPLLLGACEQSTEPDFLSPSDSPTPAFAKTQSRILLDVVVHPGTTSLQIGNSQQFIAVGRYADGSEKRISVVWSATGGTVTSDGLYLPQSIGEYRIVARHRQEHKADTALVTVSPLPEAPPALVRLTVSPDSTSLASGTTLQYHATAAWSNGTTTVPPLTWSARGGTISSTGLFTAGSANGTYAVVAQAQNTTVADSATVLVETPYVTRLDLTPGSASLTPGASQQYSALATWSDGVARSLSLSYATTGGSITSTGFFTAGSQVGTFAVIASCVTAICSIADTSLVTVEAAAAPNGVATVSLSPQVITLDIGEVYQFTATARLGDGSVAPSPSFSYSTTAGVITQSGQFTAPRSAGTVRVEVMELSGKRDTATVTIVVPTAPYFTDNFDNCVLDRTGNTLGFKWGGASGGDGEDPVVTNQFARSGSCSLKFTFVGGAAGDDAWSEQRFSFGKKLSEVYIQWYQYFPSGYDARPLGPRFAHRNDTGPDNNKLLRLWDDDYSNYRVKVGMSTLPTSGGDSQIFPEFGTNKSGVGQNGARADLQGITDARRGRWVRIQVHVRLASVFNNDGIIEMWVDGVKTFTNTTLPLYPTGGVGNYLRNGYLMGWANSGFTSTSVTFIDDITISGVPIS